MRMIISNSCFDKNLFKQNTMEIRVFEYKSEILYEKEASVKNVKTLQTPPVPDGFYGSASEPKIFKPSRKLCFKNIKILF